MRIEADQKNAAILLAGVAAVFILTVWLPTRAERAHVEGHIDTLEQQLGVDRNQTGSLDDLRAAVDRMRRTIDESDKIVPAEDDLAGLIRQLSARLARHGLTDQEILTEAIVAGRDYNMIPLTLRFRGSYDAVFSFIKDTEAMRRLVRIDELVINGEPSRTHHPVSVRVRLTTFSSVGGGPQS